MRSKAPLALMEQIIMLLVFVLAAALCLSCFVRADLRSRESARRDAAMTELQTMAETIKACGGDFDAAARISGADWDGETLTQICENDGSRSEITLMATVASSGSELLGRAELSALHDGETVARLQVCWQEVAYE